MKRKEFQGRQENSLIYKKLYLELSYTFFWQQQAQKGYSKLSLNFVQWSKTNNKKRPFKGL